MPSSSCSETNGPFSRPLPRTITLVSQIRPFEIQRSGGKATSAAAGRAVANAARSGYNTAYVFGTASANTKNTNTLITTPTTRPHVPNRWSNTIAVSVDCTMVQVNTVSNRGLIQRSGSLTNFTSTLADRWPLSTSDAALGLVMRDRPISAAEQKASITSKTPMATSRHTSVVENSLAIMVWESPVGIQ